MPIDVSEEHIASIFRVEEISSARNQRASRWQACKVDTQRTTRRYIPEDRTLCIRMFSTAQNDNYIVRINLIVISFDILNRNLLWCLRKAIKISKQ
jgi:hypothetical protein